MDSTTVSVIIPAFNYGRFIERAIKSILSQTYPLELIEIIVVDDGSTDETKKVLKSYQGRITYLFQQRKGIASARNRGMLLSKGEIITFLDADDEWYKNRIEKVVRPFTESEDTAIVYHCIELIDDNGEAIYPNFYRAFGYKEGVNGYITKDVISGRIFCGGSSFAFKRDQILRAFPIPEDIMRGIDFYLTVIASCFGRAVYIPEVLGRYRLHGGNITLAKDRNNNEDIALLNRDLAHMRQRVIERLSTFHNIKEHQGILNMLHRIKAKEVIFYKVISGKRTEAFREIPLLFRGVSSFNELIGTVAIIILALVFPSSCFPHAVRLYSQIKKTNALLADKWEQLRS